MKDTMGEDIRTGSVERKSAWEQESLRWQIPSMR